MNSSRQIISNRNSDQLTGNGNSSSRNNSNGDSFSVRRRRHQSAPPRSNSFRESSSRPSVTTPVGQGAALVVPASSVGTVSTVRGPPPPPPRHQVSNFEYVEHRAWERRGVSQDDSYYAVRGFSYNRGQQVYFNCLTTTPLNVQLNQGRISMNMQNGFGGNNAGGRNGHHQMRHHHDSSNGSAQTVNHGSNIFNFYFVNSGQYDLSFTGNGLPGVGQSNNGPYQPSGQQCNGNATQNQMSNYAAPLTTADQLFGNAPQVPVHGNNYGMYGPPRSATHAGYVSGPHQPSAFTPYQQRSPAHFQPLANGNAYSNAQYGPMPQHDGSAFNQFRQREPSFQTSYTNSQGSLYEFDEYDDQDYNSHSQCSQKSAAASQHGGPGRFDGPPPPMY